MPAQQPRESDASRLARGRGLRYAWSVAAAIAARTTAPLLSLAVTPYALAKLGPEEFGLFTLALTMSGWLTLLDPGLAPGLRIVLARRSARLDAPGLSSLLGAAAVGQNALAALTLVIGVVLATVAPTLVAAPSALREETQGLFLLMTAGTAVAVLGRRYAAALDACQWTSAENAVRLAQNVVRITLLAFLLAMGMGLRATGWSYLIACAAGAIGFAAACRRLLPEVRWTMLAATRPAFLELVGPGAWLSLGGVAGVLIAGVDRLVVARAVSLEAVTTFALSGAAFLLAEALVTSGIDAARPALGQVLGAGGRQEAARIYLRLVKTAGAAGPLAAAGVFAANRAFVTAWAGAASYGGWALDACFALALTANLWSLPHRALLSADLRAREATLWRLGEGALNLALSVGLALQFGLAGVAAGTALAGACTSLWSLPKLAVGSTGLRADQIMRPLYRGLALGAVLAPLAWLAREAAGAKGFVAAALAAMAVTLAGSALWWRVGLTDESRRFWLGLARERRVAWQAAA